MHIYDSKAIDISRLKKILAESSNSVEFDSREIAQKCGVHQSQISRILRGKFQRVSPNVLALCESMGISPPLRKPMRSASVPEVIQRAVYEIWDGSTDQAARIASLISIAGKVAGKSRPSQRKA